MNGDSHSQAAPTARGRRTQAALLDAALRLFAERGFHGASVPDVARAAGVATGTVYRHFDGKAALVNALYQQSKLQLFDALTATLDPTADPRSQFHAVWTGIARFARDTPEAFAFLELHHHLPYLDEVSRALEMEQLVHLHGFLEAARRDGLLRPRPLEVSMALVWGAFVGLFRASRAGYVELDDFTIAQAEGACWNLLSPDEEKTR